MGVKATWVDGTLGRAKNQYRDNGDGTFTMLLTQGYTTRISTHRFSDVSSHRWCAQADKDGVYVVTKVEGAYRQLKIHQVLCPGVPLVDHQDRDTLNNVDGNLRAADKAQNAANRKNFRRNAHGFVGVSFNRSSGRFCARVGDSANPKHRSHHNTAEEAARARDEAALRIYGPFARTNESLGLLPPLLVLPVPEQMAAD